MYKYADSCCYTLETNTALKSNHIPMKLLEKSKKKKARIKIFINQITFKYQGIIHIFVCVNIHIYIHLSIPGGSDDKASACNAGDLGSMPPSGRSPGERNSNPLLYSCLENPMDGETWQATVYTVAKSRTRLSDFPFFL